MQHPKTRVMISALDKVRRVVFAVSALVLPLAAGQAWAGLGLPTTGLVLGLDASQHVTTSSGSVVGWGDANGGAQRVSSTVGTPTVGSMVTPNGTHAAINFNGSSGLVLNDAAALSLQNLSIFVVGNLLSPNHTSDEFISDYHNNGSSNGWADGISDSNVNQPKWFTGPDGADALGGTTGANLVPGSGALNAYLLTESISGGEKNANAANGFNAAFNQTSAPDTVTGIPYDGQEQVGVGFLDAFVPNGLQHLTGNIAEILVYDNTAPGFDAAAVNTYLVDRYFAPEPASFAVWGVVIVGGLLVARRRKA